MWVISSSFTLIIEDYPHVTIFKDIFSVILMDGGDSEIKNNEQTISKSQHIAHYRNFIHGIKSVN